MAGCLDWLEDPTSQRTRIEGTAVVKQLAGIPAGGEAERQVAAPDGLRRRVLVVTTLAFVGCFAVWTIFAPLCSEE